MIRKVYDLSRSIRLRKRGQASQLTKGVNPPTSNNAYLNLSK